MIKIAYITSHGHSGSTLLDLIISAHPQIFSLGEINMLPSIARGETIVPEAGRCPCGKDSVHSCDFWSKVDALIKDKTKLDLDQLDLDSKNDKIFNKHNKILFTAVAKISKNTVLVDSSKSLRRLRRLQKIEGLEVYPIHLIRPAKGLVSSMIRKKVSPNLLHAIWVYNLGMFRAFVGLCLLRHRVVRYEKMVEYPSAELSPVMEMLDLDFHANQIEWASQKRHTVGGNGGVKFTDKSDLYLDDRWQKDLNFFQRLLINILAWPSLLLNNLKVRLHNP